MNVLSRPMTVCVLAVVSASVVAFEVLLTRLLSVTAWYGDVSLVLSLAMLGLAQGSITALRARNSGLPLAPWVARRLLLFAVSLAGATVIVLTTPLGWSMNLTSVGSVLVVTAACTLPMAASGAIVARLMAESSMPVAVLYGVDLVAASAGALLPLILLGPFGGPAAVLLLASAVALLATATSVRLERAVAAFVSVAILASMLLTQWTHFGLELRFAKWGSRPERSQIAYEHWNALSHVLLTTPSEKRFSLWSPAPNFSPPTRLEAMAYVDGDATTSVYAYETIRDLEALRNDATNSAHVLRPSGPACVIGVGGGRDLEATLLFGHESVLGIEINPAMVSALQTASSYSPILKDPRVRIVVADGRTALAREGGHCEVLQAALVDTWAATGAGAFAHTEATLYTREAWAVLLRRVEPKGILTFSRWFDESRLGETSRLVSLAVASLLDRGVRDVAEHIALVTAGRVATVLASPEAFSSEDRVRLEELESMRGFRVVVFPGRPPADPLLRRLMTARDIAELSEAGASQHLDTSPPTDDRPFFFQLLSPSAWFHPLAVLRSRSAGVIEGNTTATLQLLVTFVAALSIGLALLGPTLIAAVRATHPPLRDVRAWIYFGALGAGFMLAEVALVQRLHLVLGHPSYALTVVLAGLLLASGIGSAWSPSLIRTRRAVSTAAVCAAAALIALPFVIRAVSNATSEASLAHRMAWSGTCAGAVGIVLGTLFPSGLRFRAREHDVQVALALNGVASVLGGTAALLVSVWLGISATFFLAASVYLVAAAVGPVAWAKNATGNRRQAS